MQFWSCDALVYVVVCRCVRFGICSGAAPAGFGIDHPVSGGRRLAGHYPFCVSLSVRAVTCTRRVACLFSSASRACGLPFWGDMGVRACVRAASSRVSCRRRVRACAAWRPFSLLRGVAPVRAASLHFPQRLVVVVVLLALDIRGICFGSSLCLGTSFGGSDAGWTEDGWTVWGFVSGMRLFGWTEVEPMPAGPKAVGPLGTSHQETVQAFVMRAVLASGGGLLYCLAPSQRFGLLSPFHTALCSRWATNHFRDMATLCVAMFGIRFGCVAHARIYFF